MFCPSRSKPRSFGAFLFPGKKRGGSFETAQQSVGSDRQNADKFPKDITIANQPFAGSITQVVNPAELQHKPVGHTFHITVIDLISALELINHLRSRRAVKIYVQDNLRMIVNIAGMDGIPADKKDVEPVRVANQPQMFFFMGSQR